jgi:hypothetical protein
MKQALYNSYVATRNVAFILLVATQDGSDGIDYGCEERKKVGELTVRRYY